MSFWEIEAKKRDVVVQDVVGTAPKPEGCFLYTFDHQANIQLANQTQGENASANGWSTFKVKSVNFCNTASSTGKDLQFGLGSNERSWELSKCRVRKDRVLTLNNVGCGGWARVNGW